jgi:thiol-disulfide isomerase/thioredoxin
MRTVLLLVSVCRLLAEPIDGAPLLRQTAAALANADRFHFESTTDTELTSERHRSWQRGAEILARDGAGRLHFHFVHSSGSFIVVSDGITLWRASPDTREFLLGSAAGPLLDTKGGGPIAEQAISRARLSLHYLSSRLTDQLLRAEVIGNELVDVGGASIECTVVRGDYTPRPGSLGIDSWTQTFWIDTARLLVLKSESISRGRQFPDRPFEETASRHLTRYSVASINQPVPESLFRFTPPAGYREVAALERAFPRPASGLIGRQAPELSLPTLSGETLSLASLSGKIVLLDFWATWCEPCRKQMPALAKLYAQVKDQGVVLLGVNSDESAQKAQQFLTENGYAWPNLFDGQGGTAAMLYKANAIPALVLIDRAGRIAAYEIGTGDTADAAIRTALRNLGVTVP